MVQKTSKKKTSRSSPSSSSSSSSSSSMPDIVEESEFEEEAEDNPHDQSEVEVPIQEWDQEESDNEIDVTPSESSQSATLTQHTLPHLRGPSTANTLLTSSLASVKLHDESNDHLQEANTSNNSHSSQNEPNVDQTGSDSNAKAMDDAVEELQNCQSFLYDSGVKTLTKQRFGQPQIKVWFQEFNYRFKASNHDADMKIFVVNDSDNHAFRIHSLTPNDEFTDKIHDLLEIFRALCLQRKLMRYLEMTDAVPVVEKSVLNFGRLMWSNFGDGTVWEFLSGDENHLLLSEDVQNIVDNEELSEDDAIIYRNFGSADHVHCFGKELIKEFNPLVVDRGSRKWGNSYSEPPSSSSSSSRASSSTQHPQSEVVQHTSSEVVQSATNYLQKKVLAPSTAGFADPGNEIWKSLQHYFSQILQNGSTTDFPPVQNLRKDHINSLNKNWWQLAPMDVKNNPNYYKADGDFDRNSWTRYKLESFVTWMEFLHKKDAPTSSNLSDMLNAFTKAITDNPMKLDIKAPGVTPQTNKISENFNHLEMAIDTFEDEGARKLTTVQQQEACKLCLKTFSLSGVNAQIFASIVMEIKSACTKEGEETPSDFR